MIDLGGSDQLALYIKKGERLHVLVVECRHTDQPPPYTKGSNIIK
jgi:hypothetical protein